MEKLGILAGNGAMPKEVVDHCKTTNREFFVVGLEPHVLPETVQDTPHVLAKVGEIGKILKNFQKNQVKEIVFAGGVRRPSLKELIPDWEGAKLMTKLAIRKMSDDDIFRMLFNEIEKKGFKVVGAQEVMPQMLLLEGACGKTKPSKEDLEDIQTGIKVAQALGALDVGQACVVQEGMILAVEAKEGTDAMMDRAHSVKRSGKSPVLVKIVKPGQETRVDLPTIGPRTIEAMKRNGIKGMAVEIGGTLLLEREKTIKMADEAKIFIVGVKIEI
ncbi:MAG: UDP-2,3-diacylglucosamine diphosphatase LpxI [Bacteroidales bacterium]|nr:UDP-2,3-diacylglucosamine diphosphatase LpxI [Bacteroidales bacterium]